MKPILTLAALLWLIGASAQFQHDSLKTDKGYLHYFTKGNGKPVVLLQGGPGFSHHYMRAVADSVKDVRIIMIDYQGTGLSNYKNVDASWVTNHQIVQDIETVRRHLKIKTWTLVGHSYGGMFALLYGTTHPENTEKIITIASVGTNQQFQQHFGDNILSKLTPESRRRLEDIISGKAKPNNDLPGLGEVESLLMPGYFYNPENLGKLMTSIHSDALPIFNNAQFHQAYWDNEQNRNIDITKEVLAMNIPVRMIESWQDPNYDGRQLLLNHQLKNSEIKFINKSGHFPWIENPEVFYKILHDFLQTD